MRGSTRSRTQEGFPKQADEFGIHDAVDGMVRFGTAAHDSSRKLVDASPCCQGDV